MRSAVPHFLGVYQMGEVYARSVVVIGTSFDIWMPKYFASYAVQRGVGISLDLRDLVQRLHVDARGGVRLVERLAPLKDSLRPRVSSPPYQRSNSSGRSQPGTRIGAVAGELPNCP